MARFPNPLNLIKKKPLTSAAVAGGAAGTAALMGGDEGDSIDLSADYQSVYGNGGESTSTYKEPAPAPSLLKEVMKLYAPVEEAKASPEEEARREAAKQSLADALSAYEQAKSDTQKSELIETVGQALARMGAAIHGSKAGVDTSRLDLQKTDWRSRLKQDLEEFDLRRKMTEKEMDDVSKAVSSRAEDVARAKDRRQSALTAALTADWREEASRQRQAALQEFKAAAKSNPNNRKAALELEKAIMLRDMAIAESDEKKRSTLLKQSQQAAQKSGAPAELLNELYTKEEKPGFFKKAIAWVSGEEAKGERVPREAADVPVEKLRDALTSSQERASMERHPDFRGEYVTQDGVTFQWNPDTNEYEAL
jgi:hypothetical protein